jgi:hypothetical protein
MADDGERNQGHLFHPSGWDYPDEIADYLEEAGLLRRLSDDEVASLLAGDSVPNPAPMHVYRTLSDFVEGMNNFWAQFGAPRDSRVSIGMRRKAVFQRFELLYPDLANALTMVREPKSMREHADVPDYSHEELQMLYQAYQHMSELVSQDDPWVVLPDGRIDEHFLTR